MSDRTSTVGPAVALAAIDRLGVDSLDLWLAYFLLGGSLSAFDIDAYVHGAAALPTSEEQVLSHAVWEMYRDHGQHHHH